jgi:CMP-N,N'-diacetyllegionaminic acid synthase
MKFEANVVAEKDDHFKPKVVAVIPARGGSTRLPDKNMRMFCGRPLVAWTILAAVNSLTVDEVWVTSDSDRILEIAERMGAKCYKRPDVESDDAPGFVPVMQLCENILRPRDVLVGLMVTSPLRKPTDIDECVNRWFCLKDREQKFVASFVPIHEDFRCKLTNEDHVEFCAPDENHNVRYDGNVHASTYAEYKRNIATQGEGVYYHPFLLEPWQGYDVNTIEQLRFAELVFYHYILNDGLNPYEVYRRGGLKA